MQKRRRKRKEKELERAGKEKVRKMVRKNFRKLMDEFNNPEKHFELGEYDKISN